MCVCVFCKVIDLGIVVNVFLHVICVMELLLEWRLSFESF